MHHTKHIENKQYITNKGLCSFSSNKYYLCICLTRKNCCVHI